MLRECEDESEDESERVLYVGEACEMVMWLVQYLWRSISCLVGNPRGWDWDQISSVAEGGGGV